MYKSRKNKSQDARKFAQESSSQPSSTGDLAHPHLSYMQQQTLFPSLSCSQSLKSLFASSSLPNRDTSHSHILPPVISSPSLHIGSLGKQSNLQGFSSFVQTLPHVGTSTLQSQSRSSSLSSNLQGSSSRFSEPSSHPTSSEDPSSSEPSLQPVASRYIRSHSSDSASQAESEDGESDSELNSGDVHSSNCETSGKEVEIVDANGNIRKRKNFKSKDMYMLREGERVVVEVNGVGQPIGDSRSALSRWMTSMFDEPNLCPFDAKDFKEVKENYGNELLRVLRSKFLIPKRLDVDRALIHLFGVKFRTMRYKRNQGYVKQAEDRLRKQMKEAFEVAGIFGEELEKMVEEHKFLPGEVEAELDNLPLPEGFGEPQWIKYKNYLKSEEFKKHSRNGKEARALKTHQHTTGTTSFAQLRAEFERKYKRQPGYVEFFERTYKQKDGSFVEVESADFMNKAKSKMDELKATGLYTSQEEIENEVWKFLMGDDTPGRARGYGTGVTKSQVKRLRASSVTSGNESSTQFDDVYVLRLQNMENTLLQQQRKIHEQEQMIMATMQTVARLESGLKLYQTMLESCTCARTLPTGATIGDVYRPELPDQSTGGERNVTSGIEKTGHN